MNPPDMSFGVRSKKSLNPSLRARFFEIHVEELTNENDIGEVKKNLTP
jgi:hypothetical protein